MQDWRKSYLKKWQDLWFHKLPKDMRLVMLYLFDACDEIGIWNPNMDEIKLWTEVDTTEAEVLQAAKDRLKVRADGRWVLTRFIKVHYKDGLNRNWKNEERIYQLLVRAGEPIPPLRSGRRSPDNGEGPVGERSDLEKPAAAAAAAAGNGERPANAEAAKAPAAGATGSPKGNGVATREQRIELFRSWLNWMYRREADAQWSKHEEADMALVCMRKVAFLECKDIYDYKKHLKQEQLPFFPALQGLLARWQDHVDKARTWREWWESSDEWESEALPWTI